MGAFIPLFDALHNGHSRLVALKEDLKKRIHHHGVHLLTKSN